MPLLLIFSFPQALPLTASGYLHSLFNYGVVLDVCTEHYTVGVCRCHSPSGFLKPALLLCFFSLFLAGGQSPPAFWPREGLLFLRAVKPKDAACMLSITECICERVLRETYLLGTSCHQPLLSPGSSLVCSKLMGGLPRT